MKISKRILIAILSVLASLATLFGVVGCNASEPITLVGFKDTTVDGALYDDFSIASYLMAVDENENTYKGVAEVTDHEGKPVELTFNRFEPTTLNPYKIKITVTVKEDDVRTRTVTVNVKDSSTPKYTYSFTPYTGTVGSTYVLPSVTAVKKSGEPMQAALKVFYENDGVSEEQTVTDGKFIPQWEGNYRLDAEVTDQYGVKFVKSRTIVIRPQMANNALEDFNHESSYENATGGLTFVNSSSSGSWQATQTDSKGTTANGVVKFSIYHGNQTSTGRFNKTAEELTELMQSIDAITLKVMIEREGFDEFKFRFFGLEKTIPVGKWTAISVSTTEILAKMEGETIEEKIEDFATAYCNTGSGVAKSGCRLFGAPIGGSGLSLTTYVDEIIFAQIELAAYTLPTAAGGTFTLPAAKMVDINGATVTDEYTITAKNGQTPLAVSETDGTYSIGIYSGTTTVVYNFEHEGVPYSAGITYTIDSGRATMASNMLEDFGDGLSNVNATFGLTFHDADGNETGKNLSTWHETYADKKGTIAHGVAATQVYYGNQVMTVRFNRTEAELVTMFETLEYLSVRLMITRTDTEKHSVSVSSVSQAVNIGEWSTIVVTRDNLLSTMTGETETEKIAEFAKMYCAGGKGGRLIGSPRMLNEESTKLYIDEIYVGAPTLAANALEDFTYAFSTENVSGGLSFPAASANRGKHLAEYADKNGTVANGVVWQSMYHGNNTMVARFNRTAEELTAIMQNLETLTVRLLIKRDNATEYDFKVLGVNKKIPVDTWYDFTITRAEILAAMTGETEEEKIAAFAANFCKTGVANAPRLVSASTGGVSMPVYFDSITFTATT